MSLILLFINLLLAQSYAADDCSSWLIKDKLREMAAENLDEDFVDLRDIPSFDPKFFDKYQKRERLGPYLQEPLQPKSFGQWPEYQPPLKTIPVNPEAKMTEVELYYAGQFLRINNKSQLAHLPDDTYIYVIDKYERVLISSRTPDPSVEIIGKDTKFLASHRSLLNQFKIVDPNVEVIAAGEFKITHGVTSFLNNKSNTFRGDGAALRYAEKRLKESGLLLRENTQRVDYSIRKLSDKHLNEIEEARALIELRGNPRYKLIRDLFNELYEKFPATSNEAAGMPSRSEIDKISLNISTELMSRKTNGNISAKEENIYSDAVFMLSFLTSEGLTLAAERFQKTKIDEVYNTVRFIQKRIAKDPIRIERQSATPLAHNILIEPLEEKAPPVAQPHQQSHSYLHPRERAALNKSPVNETEFENALSVYSSEPEFAHHIARALHGLASNQREAFKRAFILRESNETLRRELGWSAVQLNGQKTGGLKEIKEYFEVRAPGYSRNLKMLVKGQDEATVKEVERAIPLTQSTAEFKEALKNVSSDLTGKQLKILKSFLLKESDEEVVVALGLNDVKELRHQRGVMVSIIQNHFKKDHPMLLDEMRSFFERRGSARLEPKADVAEATVTVVNRSKNATNPRHLRGGAVKGEIPDVKLVLSSPQFEKLSPKFKEILTQEVLELTPLAQQTFIRLVLQGENADDLAVLIGATKKGEMASRRMNAIRMLERHLTNNHPEQAQEFKELLEVHGRASNPKKLPVTGSIPDLRQVLSSISFENLDPKFTEVLTKEIQRLSPRQQQAFIRTILQKESFADMAQGTGISAKEAQIRYNNSIATLRKRFGGHHPEFIKQLEDIINAQKKR